MIDLYTWSTPNIRPWYTAIADRPAVQRGHDVPALGHAIPMP